MTKDGGSAYIAELDRMYEDSNYSAQTYFEAAKSAEFWGKAIVFLPALAASVASILVATGQSKQWGAVGAVTGAVAATSAFLGSDRKAKSLRDAANRFTALRHTIRLEKTACGNKDQDEIDQLVRSLRGEYNAIVASNELVANRFFNRAHRRIGSGVLDYQVAEQGERREHD
ncbi:hypothetical protein ACIG87_31230 [Micromonospora sp. NPDC051925]|uniref:hypothetical protein n=1 Tax=Micromonospora sp. NPDC051925 TaxID=3364288 RepID=UPI0037C660E8